ncbi:MAG: diaminopimelate decarboxylase [Spirochaetia bacterium]|nr:diaminopimelate decarboxylase [Spirochaetia bacterium]
MYFKYEDENLLWHKINLNNICESIEKELSENYRYIGPYYLYHEDILKKRIEIINLALPKSNFYFSVKSLSNLQILKKIRKYPRFGLDVVSEGEILRGILAGFQGSEMVFAGVGKTKNEILLALEKNLKSIHVESIQELKAIASLAISIKKTAPIGLRVNPDIPVDTHEYIITGMDENKFGLSNSELKEALNIIKESSSLELKGFHMHLGSQIREVNPYIKALSNLINLADEINSIWEKPIDYLSLGGGFGIDYESIFEDKKKGFPIEELEKVDIFRNCKYQIDFEPGRFISGYSGILIAKTLYIKEKNNFKIAITNAGMNDLLRPALYKAIHPVLPLIRKENAEYTYDFVGPVCESADFLAKRVTSTKVEQNDRIAVLHCGAYGSVMGSNYNSRPMAPEFIIEDEKPVLIRKPQSIKEMLNLETDIK